MFWYFAVIDQAKGGIKNVKFSWQTMPSFVNNVIINVIYMIFTAFILMYL